ncbi:MAG: cation diffusion facilitator family transporter [Lachnospiraceae bacterium]|nr:cation diffusion facilitator family transporter [Lachnospiraceae bacterium]MDD7378114.1 cation diffusion facilitator family transporter [Lachnospiraceae bacterium]MDY4617358.1 cation diffusion facilitator family transporter [Lachnospiraceae bacterium]MDY5775229.1 cation diffusion facilitator family transporter [Lachnospiraceae bacterium]
MVTLLAKIFIKDAEDTSSPKVRQAYGVLTGVVGILLNVLLFAGKFIAGTLSKSISITADAFNNLSDAGSSFVTLIGFKLAGAKPDPEHPFGHGRIEYVSGLVVSGAILLMAFELIKDSIDKIIHPQTVDFSALAAGILVVSILVKIYMYLYNSSISKKIDSAAMKATATDSLSDTMATTVVLIASIVGHYTGLKIDGYCGVLVGLFIFYAGFSAAKETLDPLLGQPPEEEFVEQIEEIVMSYELVQGIHDLVVHDYGPGRVMISLHAEVPAEEDILEIHDMIDVIENDLADKLNCEAVIHMDPLVTKDERVNELKRIIHEVVDSLEGDVSMHDFRTVIGPTHTNMMFDVVLPFGYSMTDEMVKEEIQKRTWDRLGESYNTVIQIDRPYTTVKRA